MPVIYQEIKDENIKLKCSCKKEIETDYWSVDDVAVCEKCYEENYENLIKCKIADCNEFDESSNFSDGMCESCYEVNTPLSPEEQEGWEDNIVRWNEN